MSCAGDSAGLCTNACSLDIPESRNMPLTIKILPHTCQILILPPAGCDLTPCCARVQLRETRDILQQTNPEVVAGVRSALRRARQVCCYGSGREGLALKGFATRLHQMNISVTMPPTPPNPPPTSCSGRPHDMRCPACSLSCCYPAHALMVLCCLWLLTMLSPSLEAVLLWFGAASQD